MQELQSHEDEHNSPKRPGDALIQEEKVLADVSCYHPKREEYQYRSSTEGDGEFENLRK